MFSRLFSRWRSSLTKALKGSGFSPTEFLAIVGVTLLLATAVRFYHLGTPNKYYFDEVYHAMTVKLVAKNDPRAYEYIHGEKIEKGTHVEWLHPPLAKYFQASGVLLFGESGFGWRFFTAVFGVLTLVLTSLVAHKLFKNSSLTVTSLFLVSMETLLIAQSRIAMNDIFVVFFTLLTFFLYLHYRESPTYARLIWVGISAGLAIASKWSGVFILGWVLAVEGLSFLHLAVKSYHSPKRAEGLANILVKPAFIRFFTLILIPPLVYLASYGQMFLQGKDLHYFVDLHSQIFSYQTRLDATHPYQSTPPQWFLDTKPVWYYVEYADSGRRDVYAIGNPIIFWAGGISAVGLTLYLLLQIRRPTKFAAQPLRLEPRKLLEKADWSFNQKLLLLLSAYGIVWLPWALSPRIMFFYHYLPAVPFLVIILAVALVGLLGGVSNWLHTDSKQTLFVRQIVVAVIFGAVTAAFIWILPQTIALKIPSWWKESLFLGGLWR